MEIHEEEEERDETDAEDDEPADERSGSGPLELYPEGVPVPERCPGSRAERPLDDPDEPTGAPSRRADERLAPPVLTLTRSSTTVSPMNADAPARHS